MIDKYQKITILMAMIAVFLAFGIIMTIKEHGQNKSSHQQTSQGLNPCALYPGAEDCKSPTAQPTETSPGVDAPTFKVQTYSAKRTSSTTALSGSIPVGSSVVIISGTYLNVSDDSSPMPAVTEVSDGSNSYTCEWGGGTQDANPGMTAEISPGICAVPAGTVLKTITVKDMFNSANDADGYSIVLPYR